MANLGAAGVLLIHDGRVLLLQRAPGSDHPGEWCCPGGGIEAGENAAEAAIREMLEETGIVLEDAGERVCQRIAEGVDYITFRKSIDHAPNPVLCGENVAAGWFPLNELPLPLHPGVAVSMACMVADELDLSKMMAAGEITSPVRYRNLWLFDLRITGTGASYRTVDGGEFVWRDPGIYLNDRFLERCAGLPVIWEHPPKMLDSEEFSNRVVGTILLPYIKGSEVWGIAKIYDNAAAAIMLDTESEHGKSTSPAVVLGKAGNRIERAADGTEFLVEGEPVLLDHLAICDRGVWDKLEAPSGVNIEGAATVAEEAEREEDKKDAAKMDAAEDKKEGDVKADAAPAEDEKRDAANIDQVLKRLDGIMGRMDTSEAAMNAKMDAFCGRMDAFEKKDTTEAEEDKKEGKAEEVAADKKDAAEDKEKEEVKADSMRLQGEVDDLKKALASVMAVQPKASTEKDFGDTADIQARYDSLFNAMGSGEAPAPRRGENALTYRRRLASTVKTHSKDWGSTDLYVLDSTAFDVAERQVFDSAMAVAERPLVTEPGRLVERVKTDRHTGVRQITFHGPNTFISGMKRQPRRASISARRAREN